MHTEAQDHEPLGVAEAPLTTESASKSIPAWAYPAAIAALGLGLAFWPLFRYLPSIWFADDTYYAHGAVIPICVGLIVWDRWPKLKVIPIRGQTWALIPLAACLYVLWVALRSDMRTVEATLLILILSFGVMFVAGWRWLVGLAVPIGYLLFGLPIWQHAIDTYTLRTQMASTNYSFKILQLIGLNPYRADASTIVMNNFSMDVGVACSGMKLVLAVMAISAFFIIVAKLNWWRNLILAAAILPLSIAVNSIRIALIGLVGNSYGDAAGRQFHDYSGYISLVLCFLILMKLTRMLGWK